MKIKNHRLHTSNDEPVPYVASPNRGDKIDAHEYLVMHFTAGRSFESSVNWLTNPRAKASAHLVIGRNGEMAQLVPFDREAWHAGRSQWVNRTGLNSYSIGIELDNAGRLRRQGSHWVTWFGSEIPDDEVIVATHKQDNEESGWHAFTEEQLVVAMDAALVLVEKYELIDLVGHDDIAPLRKSDPGPAFPLRSFRAHVMGRSEGADNSLHRTTTNLNIRTGPGSEYDKLEGSPLPKGTRVLILDELGSWRFVDVLGEVNGEMDLQGWVHGRYLKAE